jgi:hypothetical protein
MPGFCYPTKHMELLRFFYSAVVRIGDELPIYDQILTHLNVSK